MGGTSCDRILQRGICLAAVLLAAACVAPLVSYAASSGSLQIVTAGLPTGTRPLIVISGHGLRRRFTSRRLVIRGLRPGRYELSVKTVVASGADRAVRPGASVYPVKRQLVAIVKSGDTTTVAPTYGTVLNPGVESVPSRILKAVGAVGNPSAIVLPAGVKPPAVGTILTGGPTPQLPSGLLAHVTGTTQQGSNTVVALTAAEVSEAVPELSFEGSLQLKAVNEAPEQGATGAAARAAGVPKARAADDPCKPPSLVEFGAQLNSVELRQAFLGAWPPQMKLTLAVRTTEKLGLGLAAVGINCDWTLAELGPYTAAIPVGPVVIPVYATIPVTAGVHINGTLQAGTINVASTTVAHAAAGFDETAATLEEQGSNVWTSGVLAVSGSAKLSASIGVQAGLGIAKGGNLHVEAGFGPEFDLESGKDCELLLNLGSLTAGVEVFDQSLNTPAFTPFKLHLWKGCEPPPPPPPNPPTPPPPTSPEPPTTTTPPPGTPPPAADPALRGKILRVSSTGASYFIDGEGVRHWIPNGGVYLCNTEWHGVEVVDGESQAQVEAFPEGSEDTCTIPEAFNTIVRVGATGTSYYIDGSGVRHWIPNGGVYLCLREWDQLKEYENATQGMAEAFAEGNQAECTIPQGRNTIVRVAATGASYYINDNEERQWIPNGGTYLCLREWDGLAEFENATQGMAEAFAEGSQASCTIPQAKNTIVRVAATGASYYVNSNEERQWIPNGGTYLCLREWDGLAEFENATQGMAEAFAEGSQASCTIPQAKNTIVRVAATGASYYVDENEVRHWIPNGGTYLCLREWDQLTEFENATQGMAEAFAEGNSASCTIPQAKNTIVRVAATGASYYVDENEVRHWIPNGGTYLCLREWDGLADYENATQGMAEAFAEGNNASCTIPQARNKVIRVGATGVAYYVDENDVRHWIETGATYNCLVKHHEYYYDLSQGAVDAFAEGAHQPNESC